jgi:small subunit ribosomal protein S20
MPNHKSSEKRVKQEAVRRQRNRAHSSTLRTQIKKLRTAISDGDGETAKQLLNPTESLIDKSVQKGVIHRNAAARYKSRLTRQVSKAGD